MGKNYEDINHFPPHVSIITENIPITIIRFARYHLLLATALSRLILCFRYNSDLSKVEWTLLLFSFNYIRDLAKTCKLFFIPLAEYNSFSHQARTLKTNLLGLISNFSKYYIKTSTICLLFLSSHVFTNLELDSNHLNLIASHLTIMKLNHQLKKYSENINQSDIILWCPENNCRAYL